MSFIKNTLLKRTNLDIGNHNFILHVKNKNFERIHLDYQCSKCKSAIRFLFKRITKRRNKYLLFIVKAGCYINVSHYYPEIIMLKSCNQMVMERACN